MQTLFMTNVISFSIQLIYCKVFSNVLYGSRYVLSAVFDFIKTIVQLARFGPPEIWQDHQISGDSGPMVHCLEMLIFSPGNATEISHLHRTLLLFCPYSKAQV